MVLFIIRILFNGYPIKGDYDKNVKIDRVILMMLLSKTIVVYFFCMRSISRVPRSYGYFDCRLSSWFLVRPSKDELTRRKYMHEQARIIDTNSINAVYNDSSYKGEVANPIKLQGDSSPDSADSASDNFNEVLDISDDVSNMVSEPSNMASEPSDM